MFKVREMAFGASVAGVVACLIAISPKRSEALPPVWSTMHVYAGPHPGR